MPSNRPWSNRPNRRSPRPPSPNRGGDGRSRNGGPRGDSFRSMSSSYQPQSSFAYPGGDRASRDSYYPPPPGYGSFQPPQGDFSFRMEKPPGIQDVQNERNSYRPASHRPSCRSGGFSEQRFDHRNRRPNDAPYRGRGGSSYRGGYSRLAADRPFLNTAHTSTQELSYADAGSGVKYRALEDLSDSDEAEMEISDDDESGGHSLKRARTSHAASASAQSVPKWSNPDPYTAIPPPDTTQQKKKDVVQMIRKARVQPAQSTKPSVPSDAADFISCFSDDEEEIVAPQWPPSTSQRKKKSKADNNSVDPAIQPGNPASQPLGSRKRTHDDEIKLPEHARLKQANMKASYGYITEEWEAVEGRDPCPWLDKQAALPGSAAAVLHREVHDFYEYVKPRDFEQKIRQGLVNDLDTILRRAYKDATVYPFGSFMSGLYLPTGDMDLAFCSDSFIKGGPAMYNQKKIVFRMGNFLESRGIPHDNRVEIVSKAKVPLVKYVDKRTGLKVDISFENTTGVTAIQTFTAWRDEFPAMPILVTLIKHFLAMRGLNEPVNGGVGGFSVVCLVVSMLQLMPAIQSRTQTGEHQLNELLMEFFDLYGNKFNYRQLAICLNPPRYIPKNEVTAFPYRNKDRLSIIDPNNAENDIAGGSSNIDTVVRAFANAHRLLKDRMTTMTIRMEKGQPMPSNSILETILAGNYKSFEDQRQYLQTCWEKGFPAPPQPARNNTSKGNRGSAHSYKKDNKRR